MTRRLTIDDLTAIAVPCQPAVSPDGQQVVYVLRTLDADEDRNVDQLWTVPTAGAAPRRLTRAARTPPRPGRRTAAGSRSCAPARRTCCRWAAADPEQLTDAAARCRCTRVEPDR